MGKEIKMNKKEDTTSAHMGIAIIEKVSCKRDKI
jgi:hypothetical protein